MIEATHHKHASRIVSGVLVLLVGCSSASNPDLPDTSESVATESTVSQAALATTSSGAEATNKMAMPDPQQIQFLDEVQSNATVPEGLTDLLFVDTQGNRVQLEDYIGRKNIVLVFTEGFSGMLCPFCKTQTSRLVANYDRFAELDTEILVVYPGEREHLDEFLEAARTSGKKQVERVPFPIVLDAKMEAVDFFDIRSSLAHPSTYVIDKQGNVQLAYVGADMSADRPSVQALLDTLRMIGKQGAG